MNGVDLQVILFLWLIIWKAVGSADKIGMRWTGPETGSLPGESVGLAGMVGYTVVVRVITL